MGPAAGYHALRGSSRPFSVTQLRIRDGCSCPIPAIRYIRRDRLRRVVVNHRISIRWSSTFRDRPPPCRLTRSGELSDADACEPVGWSEVQVTDLVASERAISFGPFRLVPTQRLLLEDDNPVRVGSRALDILTALVERPGELVGKEELIARVWRWPLFCEGSAEVPCLASRRRAAPEARGRALPAAIPP